MARIKTACPPPTLEERAVSPLIRKCLPLDLMGSKLPKTTIEEGQATIAQRSLIHTITSFIQLRSKKIISWSEPPQQTSKSEKRHRSWQPHSPTSSRKDSNDTIRIFLKKTKKKMLSPTMVLTMDLMRLFNRKQQISMNKTTWTQTLPMMSN